MRLDKIITKLDIIITNLNIIKNNQYCIYNELKKANQLIENLIVSTDNMVEEIIDYQTEMLSNQRSINKNIEGLYEVSQISRYCNEQTQKELELMNEMHIKEKNN